MQDHRLVLQPGEEVQREVQFDFVRIVNVDGVLSMGFPTDKKEVSDFSKGDFLNFREAQREIILVNRTEQILTVWLKTSFGATLQSGLLVGDVNIVGVNQDANDEQLVVQIGRGIQYGRGLKHTYTAGGESPPLNESRWAETWPLLDVGTLWPDLVGKISHLHIVNNNHLPTVGDVDRIADKRVGFSTYLEPDNGAVFGPVSWVEESDTKRIPYTGESRFYFTQIITTADVAQNNFSDVIMIPELF